jgi:HSP20 family molecular chaperone IbpA
VSGEYGMSARWRRSKKQQKWIDFSNSKMAPKTHSPKLVKTAKLKTTRSAQPQKYRVPKKLGKCEWKAPKPLIDMFQDSNWITVVAEIAGFSQDAVKVTVKNQKLTLTAKTNDRKYYKSLNLPKLVIPSITHTTFKNGVLEIKLKKATKKATIKEEASLNDAS